MTPFNPITPNDSTEKFARPRVLLVEPDLDVLSDRTLLLSSSKYPVGWRQASVVAGNGISTSSRRRR